MTLHLLTGGTSPERPVALRSAASLEQALRAAGLAVSVYDVPAERDRLRSAFRVGDVALPVLHGKGGEDGTLQGWLETEGFPYLFSGVAACALAMRKPAAKAVVEAAGICSVPRGFVRKTDEAAPATLPYPLVVKPVDGGSSFATAFVHDDGAFQDALRAVWAAGSDALVETGVVGDEFTVAVIDVDAGLSALPVVLIRPRAGWFDFASKYEVGGSEELCPAPVPDALRDRLQATAVAVHTAVGARHLSRTDFLVDAQGRIWFLETNLIPGMTEASLLPKALAAGGRGIAELVRGWAQACVSGAGSAEDL